MDRVEGGVTRAHPRLWEEEQEEARRERLPPPDKPSEPGNVGTTGPNTS